MRILLGVTGCIAAYKSCEVLRELQRAGAEVQVVMTASAAEFVGPQTFAALTGQPVGTALFGDAVDPIPHIRLAESCDALLIAPCTANVLAKLACGIADDLLTSTALACTAPVVVAPAMNVHMYENAATQGNIAVLKRRGIHVLDPDSGYLACGDVGPGKLPAPHDIAVAVLAVLDGGARPLAGRKVVITSGPTVEPIDAVRFVSNHSSGKMGAALAAAALAAGAQVTVVSGPVPTAYPQEARVVVVGTAEEMLRAAVGEADDADAIICAAAVADYRPAEVHEGKLKKGADDAALEAVRMVRNPDILRTLAEQRRRGQVIVGFAAETSDLADAAQRKLASKGADMIVANEVGGGRGFGADESRALIATSGGIEEMPLMPKAELAERIVDRICALLPETS